MPFLITTLLGIFDKNIIMTVNFHNPGTLTEVAPTVFVTVFFLVACFATFPFAYIHLALSHNL